MILAIQGGPCSGKAVFAHYLSEKFGYKVVNMYHEYARVKQLGEEVNEGVVMKFHLEEDMASLWKIYENKLLDIKSNYTEGYVVYPFPSHMDMQMFISDKHQIVLFQIEASTSKRFARYKAKYSSSKGARDLESFVEIDDALSFTKTTDRSLRVVKTFVNNEDSIDAFRAQLDKFDFMNKEMVRPKWDTYFLRLAEVVATRSNCMKRAVGAVIVNDFRIVSTGYNGTPFGCANCNEGGCERCNENAASGQKLDECLCIHAEENAVIEAGRAKANGGTIYVTLSPCLTCAKTIVQAGIKRIVFNRKYTMKIAETFLQGLGEKIQVDWIQL